MTRREAPPAGAGGAPAQAVFDRAVAEHRAGRLDEAVAGYREALAARPDWPEALSNLGVALKTQGRRDEAVAAYRRAIALRPDYAGAHNNLGNLLRETGAFDEAAAVLARAVALDPDYAEAWSNLGFALRELCRYDEAVEACRRAIALKPDYAEARNNLGYALLGLGRLDEAAAACREAQRLKPDHVGAHWNEAFIRLLAGDFETGWDKYEWRWRKEEFAPLMARFPTPMWDGRPLDGGTLLLHAEQGLGDTIQFVRYAPLAAARGARVVVQCQDSLVRLVRTVPGVAEAIPRESEPPPFAAHAPLLSLPRLFATRLESVPAEVPYMTPPPGARGPVPGRTGGALAVGIVWGGSARHRNDRNRSVPLARFLALAEVPGVRLFSLQVGPQRAQLDALPPAARPADLGAGFDDFAVAAHAVAALDLVITVDTAPAHLAGALARPVWVLLPFAPDWRWLLDRDDSPWYPTMRLFRQRAAGDWDGVFAAVAGALRDLARRGPAARTGAPAPAAPAPEGPDRG